MFRQGRYLISNGEYYCWHTWLFVPAFKRDLDCGGEVSKWLFNYKGHQVSLTLQKNEPTSLKRIDIETVEERDTLKNNKNLIKMHQQNLDILNQEDTPSFVKYILARVVDAKFCQKCME